ncbi:hypothetical protein [Lysobacter gummosus]|uniref:hypothetical protein n=1 Tax=Lysobacter gummosus TaxID=262324 RepID=UPI00362C2730
MRMGDGDAAMRTRRCASSNRSPRYDDTARFAVTCAPRRNFSLSPAATGGQGEHLAQRARRSDSRVRPPRGQATGPTADTDRVATPWRNLPSNLREGAAASLTPPPRPPRSPARSLRRASR